MTMTLSDRDRPIMKEHGFLESGTTLMSNILLFHFNTDIDFLQIIIDALTTLIIWPNLNHQSVNQPWQGGAM